MSVKVVAVSIVVLTASVTTAVHAAYAVGVQEPAAVATKPAASVPPEREARLKARVMAWYEARKIRDQRAMYDLLEPDYRSKADFATFSTNTAARLRYTLQSYDIVTVRAGDGPDSAVVEVKITMDLGRFGNPPVVSTDPWVWRDGEWWAVFKPFEPPFRKPGLR